MAATAPDTGRYKVLSVPSRAQLLDTLRDAGRALSAGEAADVTGLHPNTARVHLEKLVAVGLAVRLVETRTTPGRPRTLYAAAPGEPAPARPEEGYKALATVLAGELSSVPHARAASVEAGRRWAAASAGRDWPTRPDAAAAVEAVVAHMRDLGFQPEAAPAGDAVLLRRCPFEEVAREHRGVVCGVHLGLLEGVFERLGAPVRVERLDPFTQDDPLLCVVRLGRRDTTGQPDPPRLDPGTDRDDTSEQARSSR